MVGFFDVVRLNESVGESFAFYLFYSFNFTNPCRYIANLRKLIASGFYFTMFLRVVGIAGVL